MPRGAKDLFLRKREVLRKMRRDELAWGSLAEEIEKFGRLFGRRERLGHECALCWRGGRFERSFRVAHSEATKDAGGTCAFDSFCP